MNNLGTLVIDKITVNETPAFGTWLMCFKVFHPDGTEAIFNIPNKEYEGDGITIDINIELTEIQRGTEVKWWMGLDDDQADVCSDAEDKCKGNLIVKKKGQKSYHPRDDWDFIINWHWIPD